MGVFEDNIVPVKISGLAEYVSRRRRISLDEALVYIYSNPLYQELYDEGAKWWYLSSDALYEEFEHARKHQIQEVSKPAFDFYVYNLELFARNKGISGLQALALFKEYDVDDFLINHYDLLHTQGTEFVMDEIERFLHRRKRR